MKHSCIAIICLATVTAFQSVCSGQADQGDSDKLRKTNNEKLSFMVGNWATEHNTGNEVAKGQAKIDWAVGGSWLRHDFRGKRSNGDEFFMTHTMNYSVTKKSYNCVMFDQFGGEPGIFYGNWVDENTLEIKAKFTEEDGTESFQRFIIQKTSEDEFKFNRGFSDDGKNYHFELEGTYKRIKKQ